MCLPQWLRVPTMDNPVLDSPSCQPHFPVCSSRSRERSLESLLMDSETISILGLPLIASLPCYCCGHNVGGQDSHPCLLWWHLVGPSPAAEGPSLIEMGLTGMHLGHRVTESQRSQKGAGCLSVSVLRTPEVFCLFYTPPQDLPSVVLSHPCMVNSGGPGPGLLLTHGTLQLVT